MSVLDEAKARWRERAPRKAELWGRLYWYRENLIRLPDGSTEIRPWAPVLPSSEGLPMPPVEGE